MKTETNKTVKFFVSVIGIVVIALVLRELSNIFLPFVIAYFLYFIFSPLNAFFKEKHVPLFLITILDLALILLTVWITSAFLIDSFSKFGEELPSYAAKLNRLVSATAVSWDIKDPFFASFSIEKIIANIDFKLLAGGLFSPAFSLLGSLLFIVFFFIFVVTGHETVYEALKRRFLTGGGSPDKNQEGTPEKENVTGTFNKITSQIQKYLISKFLINLAAGFTGFVVLGLFGIDFSIIWGVVIFLFNFIPAIGSAIALVLPVLMTLVQFESVSFALLILVVIIVLQSVFFNVIEPMIIGRRLNLNPLVILFSVLIWGYIWGIVGMLLAVPLTAIIKIMMSNSESKDLNFFADMMSQE